MIWAPSTYRFYRYFVFRHPIFLYATLQAEAIVMQCPIGLKPQISLNCSYIQFHTALFEESDIGLTVRQQFMLKIENVSLRAVDMPSGS